LRVATVALPFSKRCHRATAARGLLARDERGAGMRASHCTDPRFRVSQCLQGAWPNDLRAGTFGYAAGRGVPAPCRDDRHRGCQRLAWNLRDRTRLRPPRIAGARFSGGGGTVALPGGGANATGLQPRGRGLTASTQGSAASRSRGPPPGSPAGRPHRPGARGSHAPGRPKTRCPWNEAWCWPRFS
jgi:hypothetical protein